MQIVRLIMSHSKLSLGVRAVALLEAAKAAVVLLAGFGLLALIHHDVEALAARLIAHLHLNAASRFPRIFIDAAGRLTDARLWLLAALALVYAIVRSIEAYGLWRERAWAEWFALVTGGIYLPVEIYELLHGVNWIKIGAIVVNVAVVVYMGYMRYESKRGRATQEHKADIIPVAAIEKRDRD
jgi:uncharacterized membrane protein (DUF2068 family)